MPGDFTPYSTGVPLFTGTKPAWIPDALDVERIQSYLLYEKMYWNVPDVFKLTQRGTNNQPIYVPSGRTIVDTTNRYTAPGFTVVCNNLSGTGPDSNDVLAARMAMADFMARERFRSKFNGSKRYGIIRGDSIWHIQADELKPQGSRIRITALDPGMYFPLTAEDDIDRVIGCHLVEQVEVDDDAKIRRLTYLRDTTGPLPTVTVSDGLFELDNWIGVDARPFQILKPPTLIPGITSIPVYHTRNFDEPGNPFGSSELRGLEIIAGNINQTISDEDLALALDGIGQYVTDSSQPVDPVTKIPTTWKLGPGRVIHIGAEKRFDRVTGVGSVTPYGDHYDRLWTSLKQSSATPDIAIGVVDVTVAESGVARQIQLGPILAKTGEKNDLIMDTHNQLFYDLMNQWFPAFEQTTFKDVSIQCVVGDAVPVDRAARFTELNDMLAGKVIDAEYYRSEARKLGYVFPDDIAERITAEREAEDVFASRVDEELNSGLPPAE